MNEFHDATEIIGLTRGLTDKVNVVCSQSNKYILTHAVANRKAKLTVDFEKGTIVRFQFAVLEYRTCLVVKHHVCYPI